MYSPSPYSAGEGMNYDPYANDIARRLSGANSSEDVIQGLRSMNLGDDWWMFSFKVTPCSKSFSHKWTLCPCAHTGETARRRDPRFTPYRAVLCPLAKMKKTCPMGDNCMWAHNVFEHWLHPSRYKTRLCSFGRGCNRPICFFAHCAEELRSAPPVDDGADLDEREYLMHLMASQQHAPGTMPQRGSPMHQPSGPPRTNLNNQHMGNLNVMGMMNNQGGGGGRNHPNFCPHRASSARGMASAGNNGNGGQQQQQQQHGGQKQGGPQQQQQQQQQQQVNLDANSLLMGLQESLANFNMTVDGGWSPLGGGGPNSHGRISDPGSGQQQHVNPMRHLNRISDSGQTLSLSNNSKNLVNLETLLNSALANAMTQQQPLANAASLPNPPMPSTIQVQQQQQLLQGTASVDSQSCPLPTVTARPASPSSARAGSGSGASGSGSGTGAAAPMDSGVQDLIAQLQEQGIVTSKEQLVASLTQLLAQLLVTS